MSTYLVELTEEERSALREIVRKLNGANGKVRRVNDLLKAYAGGAGGTDAKISDALDCRTKTVERRLDHLVIGDVDAQVRRLVARRAPLRGFRQNLDESPPRAPRWSTAVC